MQNGDPYTYFGDRPIHVAEGAALDDGTLAGVVLERGHAGDMPTVIGAAFSERLRVADHAPRAFAWAPTTACAIVVGPTAAPVPLQVDGDYIGDVTEAVFASRPGALTVVA